MHVYSQQGRPKSESITLPFLWGILLLELFILLGHNTEMFSSRCVLEEKMLEGTEALKAVYRASSNESLRD